MVKIKEEPKIPTPAERAEMMRVEKKIERVLDQLARTPSDARLIDLFNRLDIAYVRLSGEKTIDY